MKLGVLAFLVPLLAIAAGLGPVLYLAFQNPSLTIDPYLWRVLRFTLLQAALSTAFSLMLGLAFGRALTHVQFPGHGLLVRLLLLPLALPAIVAVLGIISMFGTAGVFGGHVNVYGLKGILLAHVFFNFPLAARLAYSSLQSIPDESRRLAQQLQFSRRDEWRHLEWPALRALLPGTALLIFLLCAASFTIVLTLGGGPQATTLEVAIYQSLRFDFDPARAAMLSLVQIALCSVLIFTAQKFAGDNRSFPSLRAVPRPRVAVQSFADLAVIALGCLLLLPPLAAITVDGARTIFTTTFPVQAIQSSLAIGCAAALVCLLICWPLAAARARRLASVIVLAALILPPAVIATGWFVLLSRISTSNFTVITLVIALNALMALPFAWNVLKPAVTRNAYAHDRLCSSLAIAGFDRFRLIDLPALRRPVALAFVMAMIVSLGDLTAVLLFGSGNLVTLPSLIYQQMGAYRLTEAASTALLLAVLALILLAIAERLSDD